MIETQGESNFQQRGGFEGLQLADVKQGDAEWVRVLTDSWGL